MSTIWDNEWMCCNTRSFAGGMSDPGYSVVPRISIVSKRRFLGRVVHDFARSEEFDSNRSFCPSPRGR